MSYSIEIKDLITPDLARQQAALNSDGLKAVLGVAAEEVFRDHFFALDQSHRNKIGGAPTHFWGQAARSTHAVVVPEGVKISVSQVGVRQRLQGGEIHAVKSSWLTIPARAEAYGHRAADFNNLRFAIFSSGTAALVGGQGGAASKGNRKGVPRLGKGRKSSLGELGQGVVMFWLKKSVQQAADPSVIPSKEKIGTALHQATSRYLERISRRAAK